MLSSRPWHYSSESRRELAEPADGLRGLTAMDSLGLQRSLEPFMREWGKRRSPKQKGLTGLHPDANQSLGCLDAL